MSHDNRIKDEMRCPECGSASTESVVIAYAKSARTGTSGYETVSLFGEQIAPPEERDEKFWPSVAVCVAAIIALFKLPGTLNQLEIEALQNLSVLSWPVVLLSCVVGWLVGLIFVIPAIRYNVHVLPGLTAEWEKGMACRRCGHRWQRDSLEGNTVQERGHSA